MKRAEIEATAVHLLLGQPLRGAYALHFLEVSHLMLGGKASIDTLSSYCKRTATSLPVIPEGLTLTNGDVTLILYDDTIPSRERIVFTVAHELGHLYLGHTETSPRTEREADAFAASFLMPEAVIRFLDCEKGAPITPNEMTQYFSASLTACRRRRKNLPLDPLYAPSEEECLLIRRLFGS